MKYLVGGPHAVEFLDLARLDSGADVVLGDPESIEPTVRPEFLSARIELQAAIRKVEGLAQDPTRTDVARHQAARKLADTVVDKLGKAKTGLTNRADELETSALREADLALGPKADRGTLESDIRLWVEETAKKSDGLQRIRHEMAKSDDLATVIWTGPAFLLNLKQEVYETLRYEALQARKPELYAKLATAVNLRAAVAKIDKAIRNVRSSFYNPAVANQANRRVEV